MSMAVGGKGVKSDINVTPLVDVVLVLLIIFMVITPMLQRGKAVNLPKAKKQNLTESKGGDPIFMSLTRDGRVYFDKKEVKVRKDIPDALAEEMMKMPGAPVVMKADRDVPYKEVRSVLLEVSKSRLQTLRLAASEIKEGKD
jgi:biopolymer transport protein ExbD/biopolymer transport protein TolR